MAYPATPVGVAEAAIGPTARPHPDRKRRPQQTDTLARAPAASITVPKWMSTISSTFSA